MQIYSYLYIANMFDAMTKKEFTALAGPPYGCGEVRTKMTTFREEQQLERTVPHGLRW